MHVDQNNPQSAMFAEQLQDVSQRKDLPLNHTFVVPPHMVSGPEIADLIQQIYPGFGNADSTQNDYFLKRAILCPRNTEVNEINALVLKQFLGDAQVFNCVADAYQYPVEFLNSRDGESSSCSSGSQAWSASDAVVQFRSKSRTMQ